MIKKTVYIIIIFLFLSCESKIKYDKPKDLIPKEQMIDLLTDMQLVIGTSGVKNKDLEKDKNYMSLIYEKYNVDSTQFASSNIYYTANISEYENIFEEVEKRLKELQNQYDSNRDSIIKSKKGYKDQKSPSKNSKMLDTILK